MSTVLLVHGNAAQIPLRDKSTQACICSPPYFGLRSYIGVEPSIWGGDLACPHVWGELRPTAQRGHAGDKTTLAGTQTAMLSKEALDQGSICLRCGSWRGMLGNESTPDCLAWARGEPPCAQCYTCHLRTVFAAVWRVLTDDGTLWLNLSDTYARDPQKGDNAGWGKHGAWCKDSLPGHNRPLPPNIPAKNLLGIPWRVALALQSDGWVLRSDIIWNKPNPMPESVKDRPTRSYEHVFLFTKQAHYFFDYYAIRENANDEEAIYKVQLGHGYQAMYDMPQHISSDRILSQEERTEHGSNLQTMFKTTSNDMEENLGREAGSSTSRCEIQSKSTGTAEAPSIQSLRDSPQWRKEVQAHTDGTRSLATIPSERQAESSAASLLPIGEGQSSDSPLSSNSEGKSILSAGSSQTAGFHADSKHCDCGGMGNNQGPCEEQMLLLPTKDATVDHGSHHPTKQGRPTHCVEHRAGLPQLQQPQRQQDSPSYLVSGRNARDVWTFPTAPFAGEHYAAFPPELARRCILAGTSEHGCCPACQAPHVRQVERQTGHAPPQYNGSSFQRGKTHDARAPLAAVGVGERTVSTHTIGWRPSCACNAGPPRPCIVFDPFIGSGTTLLVARALGRHAVGLDLSYQYLHDQARPRLQLDALQAWETGAKNEHHAHEHYKDLPLFTTGCQRP